jgi:DNA (cytosine-5)-methyltransferase 1
MHGRPRILDLFSGIGGFSLGLERAGFETAAFCEIEPYCRQVLRKHWPNVRIHDDIRQLDGSQYTGSVDVVCGGYPCQPFSTAGKQQGEADPRHLWPEMRRIIREARPRWVIAENVRGHISLGFDTVAAQLEDDGFTVWPFIVPACAVGAPHKRERIWIVAHAAGIDDRRIGRALHRKDGGQEGELSAESRGASEAPNALADTSCELLHRGWNAGPTGRHEFADSSEALAHGQRPRLEGHAGHGNERSEPGWHDSESNRSVSQSGLCGAMADTDGQPPIGATITREECNSGEPESRLGGGFNGVSSWMDGSWEAGIPRVATGIPNRVQRLKALGNSVVPEIPYRIGLAIQAYEQWRTI